jgi:hypothetical protein
MDLDLAQLSHPHPAQEELGRLAAALEARAAHDRDTLGAQGLKVARELARIEALQVGGGGDGRSPACPHARWPHARWLSRWRGSLTPRHCCQ